jgi:ABC-type Fe3+-hydroxamate transport system substrate-binding protein
MRAVLSLLVVLVNLQGSAATAAPLRLVTLSPLLAEWVGEILGCDAASRVVVGVSDFSDFPDCLSAKPSVGPYHRVSIEKIVALKPDLVLASEEYNREAIERLRTLGIRTEVLPKERFLAMPSWIEKLGAVLGAIDGAKRQSALWSEGLKGLSIPKNRKRTVLIEVQHEPLITVGGASFLDEAYAAIGFTNVYRDHREGYPRISRESVLKADPDEIHILDLRGREREFEESRRSWSRFPGMRAVRNGRIVRLRGEDFARCTPRLLRALKGLLDP